jgi:WD40 repeat protein
MKAKLDGHADWVHSVVLSADGTTLASGAGDRSLCLWNVEQQKRVFQIPACKNSIAAVCLHPNNQQLAVVGFTNSLAIVNTSSGQTTQELDCPCVDVRTVTFSPSGQLMAAAGRDGRVRIWTVADGKLARDIETDGRRVRALAFSPDSLWLAVAGMSAEIRIFDTATGAKVITLNTRPAKVYALLFTENRQLATGGTDNRIWIWDLNSRQPTAQLVGHTGTVAALACDATGKLLVSGSYDTTLRMWNLYEGLAPVTASRESALK